MLTAVVALSKLRIATYPMDDIIRLATELVPLRIGSLSHQSRQCGFPADLKIADPRVNDPGLWVWRTPPQLLQSAVMRDCGLSNTSLSRTSTKPSRSNSASVRAVRCGQMSADRYGLRLSGRLKPDRSRRLRRRASRSGVPRVLARVQIRAFPAAHRLGVS